MDYKALLTLAAAFFILFAAMFNPLLAAGIAIGSLVVWTSYLLVTYAYETKEKRDA
ncbi:MAG TPA: hypothetical protein VF393_06500 [archaeon]